MQVSVDKEPEFVTLRIISFLQKLVVAQVIEKRFIAMFTKASRWSGYVCMRTKCSKSQLIPVSCWQGFIRNSFT
jgi:hypothetical protein